LPRGHHLRHHRQGILHGDDGRLSDADHEGTAAARPEILHVGEKMSEQAARSVRHPLPERYAMTLPRRSFLQLAAGAAMMPALGRSASAQAVRPLAERLADYAHRLRYDDLDDATVERVKVHVIDSIGCAIAAFDEKPVRICREVALAGGGEGGATII